MKKLFLAVLLLGCWWGGVQAQEGRTAKFLIDGLFFSEAPSDLEGQRYSISILNKEGGGKMFLITGITLSEKARTYAIPAAQVPDADYWLQQAGQAKKFMQVQAQSPVELSLKVGDRIGAFEVKDMQGKTWSNRNTLGRPLVLNFWYTGCGPCIKEMPELSTWVDACPDVNFLAVTWNTADEIRSIIERRGFRFVQITDDKSLWQMFGVQQTPTTVVIDRDGVVRKQVLGTNQQKRDELLECVKSLTINH